MLTYSPRKCPIPRPLTFSRQVVPELSCHRGMAYGNACGSVESLHPHSKNVADRPHRLEAASCTFVKPIGTPHACRFACRRAAQPAL